jgi:hypothetical protein
MKRVVDPDLSLQGSQFVHLIGQNQRHHNPRCPGSRRATGTVEVVLVVVGQVEVNNTGDSIDMDPPRRHISGDQGVDPAIAKGLQGPGALALATTSMDRRRPHAQPVELVGNLVSAVAGAGEDEGGGGRLDYLGCDAYPLRRIYPPKVVGRFEMILMVAHLMADRIRLITLSEAGNVAVESRREQQCLAGRGGLVEQTPDLRHEAHVGHAVSLVNHDNVDLDQ